MRLPPVWPSASTCPTAKIDSALTLTQCYSSWPLPFELLKVSRRLAVQLELTDTARAYYKEIVSMVLLLYAKLQSAATKNDISGGRSILVIFR